ncbi:MAG: DUF2188 domain-containing protein [Candidatus Omnitrophota bacterium]|jgi:hypothetical protein
MANYHVVKRDGDWIAKRAGSERISGSFDKQSQAEKAAKRFAANTGGGEVRIHDRNGKIRDSDTIPPANDPFPPRDKKN